MFDLVSIIKAGGYFAVFGIIFAESGLLIGFFLPGDSLLFTAGFLSSQGYLDIRILAPLCFIAALSGDSFGYAIGKRLGPKIFTREDSLIFNKNHVARAQAFYERHGGKAITLARFTPVIRTFAPIVAGVGKMRYSAFLFYNTLGALIWAVGVSLAGYFLGNRFPGIDHYLLPIILVIMLTSIMPGIIHIVRDGADRAKIKAGIKKIFSGKEK